MPEDETPTPVRPKPLFAIDPKWRWLATILGVGCLIAGGVATFTTEVEGGPVALLLVGSIFTFVAMGGRLPSRLKIGENEATWEELGDALGDRISAASPEEKPKEIERALQLVDVAPEAVARGIGKAASRDASLALIRKMAGNLPEVTVRELMATMAGEVMFMLEADDGGTLLVDVLAPDQYAMSTEPIADMPRHWAILFIVGNSDQVRFDLDTERPSAVFTIRDEVRNQRESLRVLLQTLLRESRELLDSK